MIPIGDSPRRIHPPTITKAIIAINALVFFGSVFAGINQTVLIKGLGVIPLEISQNLLMDTPFGIHPYLKLLSSLFVHGGFWHLAGNMLFLWIFGDNVEDKLGKFIFPLFYLAGGVCASLIQIAVMPDSVTPMVGASGAISCVMGAYLVLFPKARVDMILPLFFIFPVIIAVPATLFLVFWFGTQLLQASAGIPGVGWWAHIGGFAVGWLLIKLFYRQKPKNSLPYEIIYPS
jgi:membrane associated rhomboid family serine protease